MCIFCYVFPLRKSKTSTIFEFSLTFSRFKNFVSQQSYSLVLVLAGLFFSARVFLCDDRAFATSEPREETARLRLGLTSSAENVTP